MSPRLPLALYARVCCASSAGIPLDEILAVLELHQDTWNAENEAWGDEIAERMGTDEEFDQQYEDELFEARQALKRPVEPLESKPEAWLAFLGCWMMRPDVQETVKAQGFTNHDFFRLHQKWSEFFFDNPEQMKFTPPPPEGDVALVELQLGAWDLEAAFGEFRPAVKALSEQGETDGKAAEAAYAEPSIQNPPLFAPLPSLGAPGAASGEG